MIALALAACSDNNPATDGGPDGSLPDANKPDVTTDAPTDAPPPSDAGDAGPMAVSGTVLVSDVTVVDPAAAAVGGINGGMILIDFDNTSDGKGGTVVSGTSPLNDCIVTQYDPTHVPHATLDANTFTIADAPGDAGTTTGLLKTVGPCTYNAQTGYLCVSNSNTNQAVTATGFGATIPGAVMLTFVTPFTNEQLVGSRLIINGFTNTKYNSGNSPFQIVGQQGANVLIVMDPAGTAEASEAATSGISDTVINAAGPVVVAGPTAADFLGTGSVSINKPANSVWPAINFTASVPGQGWSLSDPGNPSALPLTGTATDIVFGCGAAAADGGSTCGPASNAPAKVMLISGTATKQDVTALYPFQMPTEVPGTDTWLTFQCAYLSSHSATLKAAALQAIMNFNPTRVEVQVTNGGGTILPSGSNQTNVIIGHTIVGHTTK